MVKRYLIFGLALIIIIGSLIAPKIIKGNKGLVKFKVVEDDEIPEQIVEMLPKYIMEERALTCKYRDDIYIVVTRGEKKSLGYSVDIDKILKESYGKDKFDIVVYAKFTDPNPDEIQPQEYDYPYIIVKTKLKSMPEQIHLDVEYVD
ncbi:protease complex subunit PrcB family protein [Lachnospiraceae bacterium NSJ-29]|uniref:Protease complex subunit PrcB family protein n=1 Tax=Wansuia hejianensis TaxID=2763667 RepID=A0A926EY64_9FIRM|nr:protease complex subunit PrcB family protein [Wansuia hejianensis]MBC8589727.1 protease complex subunit PrcB family protein [Wansuia hejianensis]